MKKLNRKSDSQEGKIAIIKMYNLQGELMLEKNFQNFGEKISFDLSQFTPGLYNILVIVDGNNPVAERFVVQK